MDNEKKKVEDVAVTVPVYTFADAGKDENGNDIAPINRKINKTMEITESFTAFDVLKYMANMDKSIADKQAEIDGLIAMKEAYIKEMEVVEKQIGVTKMQDEYQQDLADKNEAVNNNTGLDKLPVESPYTGEVDNGETNV